MVESKYKTLRSKRVELPDGKYFEAQICEARNGKGTFLSFIVKKHDDPVTGEAGKFQYWMNLPSEPELKRAIAAAVMEV